MTAKQGSLWKTSWNRGRGTPIPDFLGKMAFFQLFVTGGGTAHYATGVNSTLGLSLPYWFASVGINPGAQRTSLNNGFTVNPHSDVGSVSVDATVVGGGAGSAVLAVTGDAYVSASIVVIDDAGGGVPRMRIYFEDQMLVEAVALAPYVAPAAPLLFSPAGLTSGLHGFCGGPGALTLAEIKTWFTQLKLLLTIPPISGKTTHLYSAGAVFPTVPGVLTNLGTDATQDMTLITVGAPTPQNNRLFMRLPY